MALWSVTWLIDLEFSSRLLITWINFLYFNFKDINIWPTKPQVLHYIQYPTTRIIDATTLIHKYNCSHSCLTKTITHYIIWSHFVSIKAVRYNLSKHRESGDSIMADRGFTIADLNVELSQYIALFEIAQSRGWRGV